MKGTAAMRRNYRTVCVAFFLAVLGCTPTPEQLDKALLRACEAGDAEGVALLLEKGADPNCQPENVLMPLAMAASRGDLTVVKLLLDAGADIKGRPPSTPPIHAAAKWAPAEMVEFLLENGADVNDRDSQEAATPLHMAAVGNNVGAAKVLLAHGADVKANDFYKRTPLRRARENNAAGVTRLLQEHTGPMP